MLFFLNQNFHIKPIERDRFHKVALTELCMIELLQLFQMLFQYDRTGEVKRLAKFVKHRRPPLNIRGSCERKLPHDFRLYFLMFQCFCPDAHYF